jgi:hypothetical protein
MEKVVHGHTERKGRKCERPGKSSSENLIKVKAHLEERQDRVDEKNAIKIIH